MALVSRFSRLFTADVHAVLDRLEEPDVLLKQALREMDEEVQRSEQHLRLSIQDLDTLRQNRDEIQTQLVELDEQLDLCFESNQEELAKSLLRRKLPAQKLLKSLEGRSHQVQNDIRKTHETLANQRQRLVEIQEKAHYVCERPETRAGATGSMIEPCVSEEDIEIAFLREKQKRTRS